MARKLLRKARRAAIGLSFYEAAPVPFWLDGLKLHNRTGRGGSEVSPRIAKWKPFTDVRRRQEWPRTHRLGYSGYARGF